MKNLILIAFTIFVCSITCSANKICSKKHWIKTAQKEATVKDIASNLEYFNLSKFSQLKLEKTIKDTLGFVHYQYGQLHNNIPVENASVRLHEKNGKVQLVNGKTVHHFVNDDKPSINESLALKKALNFVNAELYAVE